MVAKSTYTTFLHKRRKCKNSVIEHGANLTGIKIFLQEAMNIFVSVQNVFILQALNNFLDEALSRLENHQHKYETLSQEQKVLDILTSLAVIYLMVKFDMISQDVKVSQSLFWAFLVKPDNENRTCPEYSEVLEKHVKGHEK